MKYIKIIIIILTVASITSCIKNKDVIIETSTVEIDWASYVARTSGYPFTLFTRVPREPGRAVYNAANAYGFIDPALTRSWPITDTIRMRINLNGAQVGASQTFDVRVAPTYTTAIEGPVSNPAAHFELLDRTVTIPANSNFGFVRWVVRNPGVTNNLPVTVVFQLLGNATTKVNDNYQYIGWSIAQ